jgi:hypothetical protein
MEAPAPARHTLEPWEGALALLLPIAAPVLAIWRFGRGDVGPGIADLMLGSVGFLAAIVLTTLLAH